MPFYLEGDIAKVHPNELDVTLEREGAAAEAKATGEAIRNAKSDAMAHTDSHAQNAENPHKVTKTHIGLGKVDNTSDSEKPVSVAQAAAMKKISDDLTALVSKKSETKPFSGTLLAGEWSEEAPYTQVIDVNGITENDEPFVDVDLSEVENVLDTLEAWGMVGRCAVHESGKVTAYCYQERPGADIPLKFKVVR